MEFEHANDRCQIIISIKHEHGLKSDCTSLVKFAQAFQFD